MAAGSQRQVRVQPFEWDKVPGEFAPTADPIDVEETRVGSIETKTARRNNRFLKGPVPWHWIVQASALPGKALVIGLCLWRLQGATKSPTITLSNAELAPFSPLRPECLHVVSRFVRRERE
jgi:hypothetical protein